MNGNFSVRVQVVVGKNWNVEVIERHFKTREARATWIDTNDRIVNVLAYSDEPR